MPCSHEEFRLRIAPSEFHSAGIPRVRTAIIIGIPPLLFYPLLVNPAWQLVAAGFIGLWSTVALTFLLARSWKLRRWSRETQQHFASMRELNMYISDRVVDALLARFDPAVQVAREQVEIELRTAVELRQETAQRKDWPRWLGMLASAVLGVLGSLASRSDPRITAVALLVGISAAFAFHLILQVVDQAFPSEGDRLVSFIHYLRLAKRRLDLQVLEETKRPPLGRAA